MAIPNTFTNGTLADADEVNANFAYINPVSDIIASGDAGNWVTLVAFNSTTYSGFAGSNIQTTTDSGATWTNKNVDLENAGVMGVGCKADSTHAVAVETSAAPEVAFTDDSGTTWTTRTSLAMDGGVNDVSFPTATLIVVGGQDGGGDTIEFSTDDGGTWTAATTSPSATVYAVDMFDGTTGYAIDASNNIWKTVNSGVDWSDTGDDVNSGASDMKSIITLTADICLVFGDNGYIEHYTNSTNTVVLKASHGTLDYNFGFVETGGKIFTIMRTGDGVSGGVLFMSEDAGLTWTATPTSIIQDTTDRAHKRMLVAYDTGKIMWSNGTTLYKRDYSNL